METKKNKIKGIAIAASALLIVSLVSLTLLINTNRNLRNNLDELKLSSERLLSEKLNLDKINSHNDKQIQSLLDKNAQLNKDLLEKNKKLDIKIAELNSVKRNNSNTAKLEKEISELKEMKTALENQIAMLNSTISGLNNSCEALTAELEILKAQNNSLAENNRLLIALSANNYRVDATKGKKDKLTSVAARTKKITMGFDVPENVMENIRFKITTPDGKSVQSEKDGLTWVEVENQGNLYASLSAATGDIEVTRRIEMTYKPEKKLKAGVYKIDIYNNGSYIGSCQVRLR